MDELTAKYRLTFSGIGEEVLGDILDMTHFGQTLDPDNKVQIAEYNVGIVILARMGIFSAGTKRDVIRALSGVTPKQEQGGDNGRVLSE